MNIKINGKEYPIYIGLDCISYLNGVYVVEQNGVKISQGINLVVTDLYLQDPLALFHLIKAGTITAKSQPSSAEIKAFIENEADYEELFPDFLDLLRTARVSRNVVELVEKNIREADLMMPPPPERKQSTESK